MVNLRLLLEQCVSITKQTSNHDSVPIIVCYLPGNGNQVFYYESHQENLRDADYDRLFMYLNDIQDTKEKQLTRKLNMEDN